MYLALQSEDHVLMLFPVIGATVGKQNITVTRVVHPTATMLQK